MRRDVVLRDRDRLFVSASIDSDGRLTISGQDLRHGEYEYFLTVRPEQVPLVVAVLGGGQDDEVLELLGRDADAVVDRGEKTWLETAGVRSNSSRQADAIRETEEMSEILERAASETNRGHVFVAHTKLENLQYDAAIIPTDYWLTVERYWGPALGVLADSAAAQSLGTDLRPDGWRDGETVFARVPDTGRAFPAPAWFLAVGRSGESNDVDWLIGNLVQVLTAMASSRDVIAGKGRATPLVALGTLGVGKGGFEQERGEVIRRLLAACQHFVAEKGVDVVFAVSNAADYSAFQQQRRRLPDSFPSLSDEMQKTGRSLAEMAKAGKLALFIGAGASMPAGLPSWGDLLAQLADAAKVSAADIKDLESSLDQAEYLVRKLGGQEGLQNAIRASFRAASTPGLSHVQLAALGCREVVTTNYDSLYETAFDATRPETEGVKVLPFEQKKPFDHWILKMHGDLAHKGDIVLSRSDFVGYTSSSGPIGAIVQALMLTRHLLVVGTSMTDDNFLRLAYEVAAYLNKSGHARGDEGREPLGTILDLNEKPLRKDFWKGTFNYLGVSSSPVQEERTRDLSIMLDSIAMHAAEVNHLLDERYKTLLDESEKDVAAQARDLARTVESLPNKDDAGWERLHSVLTQLGAEKG